MKRMRPKRAKKTRQNETAFRWTAPRLLVAQLLAEDALTDEEIAVTAKIARATLARWKLHPDFVAKVDEFVRKFGNKTLRHAIARRTRRFAAYDRRWEALKTIVAERGESPEMASAPGGRTGYLVRNLKSIGGGDNAQVVEEFAVDAALLKGLLDLEKQAAREAGQWTEKRKHSGTGGGLIPHEHKDTFDPLSVAPAFRALADAVLGEGVATIREDGSLQPVDPTEPPPQAAAVPPAR